MDDHAHLIEFERDGSTESLLFHPDLGRHRRTGRFDGDATIHLDSLDPLEVEVKGPHLLHVDGHPHRRILDDGTIVDYPRTLAARFTGPGTTLLLDEDGTLTHERVRGGARVAERGRYDLHRGFAHADSWGRRRGILLLPGGDLRLGREEYRRLPASASGPATGPASGPASGPPPAATG